MSNSSQIREHVMTQMPADRMPPGGRWSEPPAIYLALAAMLKSDCLKYPDELPGPHGLVVEKVLAEMRLKDGQRNEAIERMVADLGRFLSGFVIRSRNLRRFSENRHAAVANAYHPHEGGRVRLQTKRARRRRQ